MAETLGDVLEKYEMATLQSILSFMGYKPQEKGRISKAEIIRLLSALVIEPTRVVKAYASLSPVEREVIVALQRQGGEATRGAIRRRLRDRGLLDVHETKLDTYSNQQPDFRRTDSHFLDEILAHLLACGLVFGRPTPDNWGHTTNISFRMTLDYFIPEPVLKLLPAPPELPPLLPQLPAPPKIIEGSARIFQRDLFLYWSYVYHNHPELIAKGLLAKRHLTAVNETLLQRETITTGQGEADFPRLMFLRMMLIHLGLIAVNGTYLQALPGEKFFSADPAERIRLSFEAYVTGRQFNELAENNPISSYGERLLPVPDRLIDARKALVLYFRLAAGWTGLEALIDRIRETNYEFLLPRSYRPRDTTSYYYTAGHPYTQYGNPLGWEWNFIATLDESEGWRRVEGHLIAWTVTRALYWMGLVDLGQSDSQPSDPDSFRLTAPGRWLLAAAPAPEIPLGGGQVVVQPDFTVLAFDPISDGVLFRLEQFARRVSAERAALYRLTQQSVYAAQQMDWDAARIQAYLEELSHQPLPANIARTLAEWQASHERIRILAHVNLLHAPQPSDLDQVAARPKTQALVKHRPSPGVVVLPANKKLGEVHHDLAEIGWWPVITPKKAVLPAGSVSVDDGGRLTFLQHSPGLYLRAHLARFAEPDGDGYRLTAASIRGAATAGMEAPQIITELNRVLKPALSPALEQCVLAWSGHFGQAQVEEVTLLRFKNGPILTELRHDPELGSFLHLLRPEDVAQTALVRAKDVDKLRRLLEARGVDWKDI